LCRAAGVPARWQSGWQTKPGDWNMHDWSEFYVEPWGWLPADASYGVRWSWPFAEVDGPVTDVVVDATDATIKHFKIFGPHCIIGTPDAEIVDELDPKPGDFQIQKKHYSAFNSTRLDAVLRELDVKRLFFTGAWTEACVQHTVIDAFYLNYDISVISDAVSSPHRDAHDYALNYMRQYHRAKIITSDQALAQFRTDAAAPGGDDRPAPLAAARPSYAEWGRASRAG
jgi:nicotinamidase-related amidase